MTVLMAYEMARPCVLCFWLADALMVWWWFGGWIALFSGWQIDDECPAILYTYTFVTYSRNEIERHTEFGRIRAAMRTHSFMFVSTGHPL